MMGVYPECFAWKASLHAVHLAVWKLRRCATADGIVWTGQMKNAAVRLNTMSGVGGMEGQWKEIKETLIL